MKPGKKGAAEDKSIDVVAVTRGVARFAIIGDSPLVLNRLSEKAKRELLLPYKKTAADKRGSLKHDPIEEFLSAPHTLRAADEPTYLALPSAAFKKSMSSAALDMPGANKSQIGRLVHVDGELTGIYGLPRLFMRPVRSADMNHTPDIRTRVIIPEWACFISVKFVTPLLRESVVVNLLAGAGLMVGVGDGRQEKGALTYGQFRLTREEDPSFKRILAEGGRKAQIKGMEDPTCYDDESEELLSWFVQEKERRGFTKKASV